MKLKSTLKAPKKLKKKLKRIRAQSTTKSRHGDRGEGKPFTCEWCKGTFTQSWPEEEAEAELAELFPGYDKECCAMICEDCWKAGGFGDLRTEDIMEGW